MPACLRPTCPVGLGFGVLDEGGGDVGFGVLVRIRQLLAVLGVGPLVRAGQPSSVAL